MNVKEVKPPDMKSHPAIQPQTQQAVQSHPCNVQELSDGSLQITFPVDDPQIIRRLKSRAGTMPLSRYMWENILKRAVVDHVL